MLMPLFVLYIFMSIRTTLFLESANPVAVQLLLQLLLLLWFLLSFLFVVLLLQLLLPLHVMLCVCSSFFCLAQRCLLIVVLLLQLPLPLHVMLVVFVLPFFFGPAQR